MKWRWLLLPALLLGGCTTNRSFVRDTLATLPSGDVIAAEAEVVQGFGCKAQNRSWTVWRRNVPGEHLVAVRGRGEMAVKDVGRILEEKGATRDWHKLRGNTPPTVRVSADGNRAWLVSQGQVIASFDYDSGAAIFGTTGQPTWATAGS
jgi:hypothetical protein